MSVAIHTFRSVPSAWVSDDPPQHQTKRWTSEASRDANVHHKYQVPSPKKVNVKPRILSSKLRHIMPGDTFITYTHPDQQYDKKNKKKVASYIGTHYRNRSRPAARHADNIVDTDQNANATNASEAVVIDGSSRQLVLNRRKPAVHRDSHGLRTDPFTSYPIKPTKCVPGAIDYWLNHFAPTHVIRPELIKAEDSTGLVKEYFQLALSHPLLFETIVALSQINLTSNQWADQDENSSSPANSHPDKHAMSHYGKALARLRKVLNDETARMEDAVVFAIATLMGVDVSDQLYELNQRY